MFKEMLVALFIFSTFFQSITFAKTKTAEVKCQQDDGDQWYEAAIIPSTISQSSFRLVIVSHDVDTSNSELVYNEIGYEKEILPDYSIYTDANNGTLMIGVKGIFVVTKSDGMILKLGGLNCFENETIEVPSI